ncbi:MFS transporter [Metarhizium robertsii]|uniref:MFS multidrug transporter n=2 Tax=Metarhizium robertsii TaxID=568076 RepID=E9FB48_METRA|nr:MFS multidrug transporter [Metarhizium robertsii ARSEF 23]EFY95048.1 MFS multidrug transporter [Metarhizium robertsii ARSEF 23]EXU96481.1 MFS transporter [Metarhizium robertsii]
MAREADVGFNGYSSDMSTGSKLNPNSDHDPVTSHPDSLRSGEVSVEYIQGPRFRFICAAIAIMMFITNMEIPVLITALIAITSDLGGFDDFAMSITHTPEETAVIIIFAKFSDIFGRKPIFLLSTATFIIFSAACSAAQTLTQLIVFRAFQGIGGGGCFSLCTIMVFDLVPPENVPIAAPALVISVLAIPSGFPHHGQVRRQTAEKTLRHSARKTLGRIDIPGTVLVLLAVLGLTAAFEEADKLFPWKSAYVIVLLIVSGLLWIVLIWWERYVSLSNSTREPVLPWRLLTNRRMMGIFLNFLLLGGPTVIGMFIIPQRFQLVYGTSGLDAGVRLIPFTAAIPVSSVFASSLVGKYKVPPLYLIMSGSCLQILGFGLLGTLPATLEIPARIYGYELIAGWGCGINFSLLFLMVPFVIEKRDHAIGLGAASQFRFIGSSMVLAISTSVFNSFARPRLQELGVAGADSLVAVLATLPTVVQEQIRYTLAEGYSRQTLALCVSAALQVPASLLMWTKKPLVV